MRKAKAVPEPLPKSHLIALQEAEFTVMSYLNQSVRVDADGSERLEWLPRICIGKIPSGGFRLLEWMPASHPHNNYGFDGWQPMEEHSTGGMCKTVGEALGWFEWLKKQKGGSNAKS